MAQQPPQLDDEHKALIVALNLLAQQVGGLTSAVTAAANTQKTEADYLKQATEALEELADKIQQPPPAPPGPPAPSPPPSPKPKEEDKKSKLTPYEEKLKEFRDDPQRRDRQAKEALDAAQKREREQNRGFGGRAAAGAGRALTKVLGQVALRFVAIAGPLALLTAMLSQQISGFQVLGTAVKVLAMTLAPVLLPVTVLLATAFLAVAEVLFEQGMPVLAAWFQLIIGVGIPALSWLIQAFQDAADIVTGMFQKVQDGFLQVVAAIYRAVKRLDPSTSAEEDEEWIRNNLTGYKFEAPWSDDDEASDRTAAAMTDVLRSLRMSIGPKAQISDLGGVGRSAQLAALNQDPIEARMLKVQEAMLRSLETIAAATNARRRGARAVYDTGAGDYEGGSSSAVSGDYGGDEEFGRGIGFIPRGGR